MLRSTLARAIVRLLLLKYQARMGWLWPRCTRPREQTLGEQGTSFLSGSPSLVTCIVV